MISRYWYDKIAASAAEAEQVLADAASEENENNTAEETADEAQEAEDIDEAASREGTVDEARLQEDIMIAQEVAGTDLPTDIKVEIMEEQGVDPSIIDEVIDADTTDAVAAYYGVNPYWLHDKRAGVGASLMKMGEKAAGALKGGLTKAKGAAKSGLKKVGGKMENYYNANKEAIDNYVNTLESNTNAYKQLPKGLRRASVATRAGLGAATLGGAYALGKRSGKKEADANAAYYGMDQSWFDDKRAAYGNAVFNTIADVQDSAPLAVQLGLLGGALGAAPGIVSAAGNRDRLRALGYNPWVEGGKAALAGGASGALLEGTLGWIGDRFLNKLGSAEDLPLYLEDKTASLTTGSAYLDDKIAAGAGNALKAAGSLISKAWNKLPGKAKAAIGAATAGAALGGTARLAYKTGEKKQEIQDRWNAGGNLIGKKD